MNRGQVTATGVVKEFRGEYAFLSNFYVNPFTWRNEVFSTGEHAFSFAKVDFTHDFYITDYDKILNAPTPSKAKYHGRSLNLNTKEWDKNRVRIMREIVHARFQTSETDMVGPLINTGAMLLVEGNNWGDTFWGRCNGKGYNTLGVILMEERGYWLKGNY